MRIRGAVVTVCGEGHGRSMSLTGRVLLGLAGGLRAVLALTKDDHDATEAKKFTVKLRAEQETALALARQLQLVKQRATDATSQFLLQRKLAEKQRDWAIEKPELEAKIAALSAKIEALTAASAGGVQPTTDVSTSGWPGVGTFLGASGSQLRLQHWLVSVTDRACFLCAHARLG